MCEAYAEVSYVAHPTDMSGSPPVSDPVRKLIGEFRNGQPERPKTVDWRMPVASVEFYQVPLSLSIFGIMFGFPQ